MWWRKRCKQQFMHKRSMRFSTMSNLRKMLQLCCWWGALYQMSWLRPLVVDHHSDECIDINECENGFANCEPRADCVNLEGNFMCQCHNGFAKVDGICRDIDECGVSDPCDHICTNLSGSFECSCNKGYNLVDGTECEDINECELGMYGENSSCSNIDGGYDCECNEGSYDSNANQAPTSIQEAEEASENTSLVPSCVDINESSFTIPYCGDNSICTDQNEVGATCHWWKIHRCPRDMPLYFMIISRLNWHGLHGKYSSPKKEISKMKLYFWID